MDDQSSKIHAEARVEVLMEDTQKAADQHTSFSSSNGKNEIIYNKD